MTVKTISLPDRDGGALAIEVQEVSAGVYRLRTENQPVDRVSQDAVIALNGSLSAAIDLGKLRAAMLIMPAAWDAAGITLQGSVDGVTYGNLYNAAGTEYAVTAAVDRMILLDKDLLAGVRYLKVRSGTAGAPVVQTAARTIKVISVP